MNSVFIGVNAAVFCVFAITGSYWFEVGNPYAGANAFCVCGVVVAWYLQMRRKRPDYGDCKPGHHES